MKAELKELSVAIESDLRYFYEIGDMIRLDQGNEWLHQKEEQNIQTIFKKNAFRCQVLVAKSENALARLIAFIDEKKEGFIGWYECNDNKEIHDFILNAAVGWFQKNGCKTITGPMNGNTWNNYRFNETCSYPLFPGEPFQPLYYVNFWKDSGFRPAIRYTTEVPPRDVVQPMTREELDLLLSSNKLQALNLTVDVSNTYFEKLHQFYHVCFANNPMFHPITLEEYELINKKTAAILNPGHSFLILDSTDNVAGIFISFNDYYHSLCSGKTGTPEEHQHKKLVIKTLAVSPEYRNKQLGTLMINFIHHTAYQNGYEQVIHALMYDGNLSSTKGKEKFKTEILRSYCLLTKEL